MKVKVFTSISGYGLEEKVNKFITREDIKVIELKFSTSLLENAVMVVYEEV